MAHVAHYTSKISSKGQLVIPAKLRKKYGMRNGTRLLIGEADGKIFIELNRYEILLSLRGTLAEYPLEEELMADPIRTRG